MTFIKSLFIIIIIIVSDLRNNYTRTSEGIFGSCLQVLSNKRLKFKYPMIKEFTFLTEPSLPKMIIVIAAIILKMPGFNFLKICLYQKKEEEELPSCHLRGNQKEYDF